MYFIVDESGVVHEATTLTKAIDLCEEVGEFWGEKLHECIAKGSVEVFKGTRVRIKYIPPQYSEVVEPKKPVAKKPTTKAKR